MLQDFTNYNWKTTLAGIIGATVTIIISYLNGEMDLQAFAIAFVMAVLGFFAKDGDKTGTVQNPRSVKAGGITPPPVQSTPADGKM